MGPDRLLLVAGCRVGIGLVHVFAGTMERCVAGVADLDWIGTHRDSPTSTISTKLLLADGRGFCFQ